MAVPTITAITPPAGRSGGQQMVKITGTGFRLPNAPPASGPVPTPPPSVAVTFGGRSAPRVLVLSATALVVFTPAGAPGLADVVVRNLDPDGVPIVGEVATAVGGFTFRRPDLAGRDWSLQRVVRTLIKLFREQYLENTVHTTHTDFDADVVDGENIVEVSKLPACVIAGPELRENRFFSQNDRRRETQLDGSVTSLPPAWTADAVFTIAVFSSSQMELLALLEAFPVLVNQNYYLVADRDASDPSLGTVQWEMDFAASGDPKVMNTPNNSNVRCFVGMIEVRGIDLDPPEAIAVDAGKPLVDVTSPTGETGPDVSTDGGYTQFLPDV